MPMLLHPSGSRGRLASPEGAGASGILETDLRRAARRHDVPSFRDQVQRQVPTPEHAHSPGRQVGAVLIQ